MKPTAYIAAAIAALTIAAPVVAGSAGLDRLRSAPSSRYADINPWYGSTALSRIQRSHITGSLNGRCPDCHSAGITDGRMRSYIPPSTYDRNGNFVTFGGGGTYGSATYSDTTRSGIGNPR